jgi:hypothetical protein
MTPREPREQAGRKRGADIDLQGIVARRTTRHPSLRGWFAKSGMASRQLKDRRNEPR